MAFRLFRITLIGCLLAYGFQLSRQASIARGDEDLPGMLWAIGALSFLFVVRAFVTENTESNVSDLQKDLLWGLSAGGVFTILLRLLPLPL